MKICRFLAIALTMILLVCQAAAAEETYIDLQERFGDVQTYEYEGATYYMKNRVSTTLVLCANLPPEGQTGAGNAELILILPIDDDAKTASPIQFDAGMTAGWLEGEDAGKTLGELYAQAENADEGSLRLMEAINALFPAAVIEHYALLDLRGLPNLDGIENTAENVAGEALVERLKAIKTATEANPDADLKGMLNALTGYIVTDMKSGAMIKVVDKVDRYDRSSRVPFPAAEQTDETIGAIYPDLDAFEAMMLEIYFTGDRAW